MIIYALSLDNCLFIEYNFCALYIDNIRAVINALYFIDTVLIREVIMRSVIDFLIRLKQENEPKTIEQMRRMSSGIYKEFILEYIENGYIVETSKTPLGIERYFLSPSADKMVNDAISQKNNTQKGCN